MICAWEGATNASFAMSWRLTQTPASLLGSRWKTGSKLHDVVSSANLAVIRKYMNLELVNVERGDLKNYHI